MPLFRTEGRALMSKPEGVCRNVVAVVFRCRLQGGEPGRRRGHLSATGSRQCYNHRERGARWALACMRFRKAGAGRGGQVLFASVASHSDDKGAGFGGGRAQHARLASEPQTATAGVRGEWYGAPGLPWWRRSLLHQAMSGLFGFATHPQRDEGSGVITLIYAR